MVKTIKKNSWVKHIFKCFFFKNIYFLIKYVFLNLGIDEDAVLICRACRKCSVQDTLLTAYGIPGVDSNGSQKRLVGIAHSVSECKSWAQKGAQ